MNSSKRERKGAVVITGASSGIGKATALRLDRVGFKVYAGVRKEADGVAVAREATGALEPLVLDITDAESIAAAAARVAEGASGAGLAGLVNNAGIAMTGALEFFPVDELRQALEVNVVGQVAVTQAFVEQLRRHQGRIVNIGSMAGKVAAPFMGAYAASKHAMEAITDSLRVELSPWGIAVALVEPGAVKTPIWKKTTRSSQAIEERLSGRARELYGDTFQAVLTTMAKAGAMGVSPESVAAVVEHALTARTPRTRYVVGVDAYLQLPLAKLAPDRVRDWVLGQAVKLMKR